MSELTYKKIVDVEQVETLNDTATVFINDNGAMKQVAADKFGAVKSIDGIMPDETGNIEYGRSNPIPFNKAGNTIKCTMTFAEAIAIASSGTNQANVTLALSTFDANTSLLTAETKYASSVTVGIKAGAGEKLWLQADFDMDDGSVIRLQLNPDESVTETIIKPEGNASGSGGIPRLFVISEPIDEEPFMKMTPSMTYEELKALLEADNPPILVVKEIYEEEGVQDVALYVQNCSYFIGDGVIKMRADCEMRYTSDGTFEPVPV